MRLALRTLDLVVGPFNRRVRAVCRYGVSLVDTGGSGEFRALVRHRLRKVFARASTASPRYASGPSITIDARRERLSLDGQFVSKPTWCRTDGTAALTLSVVIPCFNYGAYLDQAVDSARRQTLGSVEIIVVDDGSTDAATVARLDALTRAGDVRVLRQENRGLSAARNAGIAVARGEYVCCLDADDWIEPTYLEQAVAVLESDRSIGFAGSWVQFFGDASEVWHTRDFDPEQARLGNMSSVASVFRRDDWAMVGGYTEAMREGFEDWDFWIRLATSGRRGGTIARPLLQHRRHGRNMTDTAKAREAALRAQMRDACPAFYADAEVRRRITQLTGPADSSPLRLDVAAPAPDDHRRALLVVVEGLLQGGAHTLLADIVRALGDGWRTTIVTTGAGPHALEPVFADLTADIVHLDGFLPRDRWSWFVDHLIASRQVRVVLSSDCRWHLEQAPRLREAHPGVALLDLTHNHVPTGTFREAVAQSPLLARHVVVSRAAARAMEDAGVPASRIVHLPNGVDDEVFTPVHLTRDEARVRFDSALPPQQTPPQRRLLWVGRLSPEKRPAEFIALVQHLRTAGHHVVGLMVGDGLLASDVDAAIRSARLDTHVTRVPHIRRDNLAALYIGADLLVLTSTVEGMPLVVLEALASGCPVAATDVGDVAQVVTQGVNGVLASTADGALAAPVDAFLRSADDEAMRARAAASLRQSRFRLRVMSAEWRTLLDEVTPARGPRQ